MQAWEIQSAPTTGNLWRYFKSGVHWFHSSAVYISALIKTKICFKIMIVQTQHNNYIQNTLLNINLMAKVFGNLKQIVNLARAIRVFGTDMEQLVIGSFLVKIELHNINKNCAHLPLFAGAIFPSPWLEVLVSTSTCFKWNAIKDAHSSHVIILKMQHLTRTHALNSFNLSFYFILLRCSLFYGNIISFKAQL